MSASDLLSCCSAKRHDDTTWTTWTCQRRLSVALLRLHLVCQSSPSHDVLLVVWTPSWFLAGSLPQRSNTLLQNIQTHQTNTKLTKLLNQLHYINQIYKNMEYCYFPRCYYVFKNWSRFKIMRQHLKDLQSISLIGYWSLPLHIHVYLPSRTWDSRHLNLQGIHLPPQRRADLLQSLCSTLSSADELIKLEIIRPKKNPQPLFLLSLRWFLLLPSSLARLPLHSFRRFLIFSLCFFTCEQSLIHTFTFMRFSEEREREKDEATRCDGGWRVFQLNVTVAPVRHELPAGRWPDSCTVVMSWSWRSSWSYLASFRSEVSSPLEPEGDLVGIYILIHILINNTY